MASSTLSADTPYEVPKLTLAIPATSRSGKPIEYSTSTLLALGHGAPSPSDYIKKFSGPPSPLRRPKRSKKVTLALKKKKAKTMAVALPIPTSSAELDAAIDAAAEEDSDTEVRQKSPVVQLDDSTTMPVQAVDPTPTIDVTTIPANPDPTSTVADTTSGASTKKKLILALYIITTSHGAFVDHHASSFGQSYPYVYNRR
uniref:Uncharacterized protein n=1 Tax=Oryza brachyantha TaxID=4533 RepID=J3LW28_ORYBR